MRVLLAAAAVLVAGSGQASALDADGRLSAPPGPASIERPLLLAELKPDASCLRVRTVPIAARDGHTRNLLLVPCRGHVVDPPTRPWGDRPPIVIPVAPPR